jgi:ferredoxin
MNESDSNRQITRRQLLNMASPLGMVTLAKPVCTACGNCAAVCSTGALSVAFNREKETCSLLFKHNLCTACGDCVDNCPEHCIKLEHVIDFQGIERPADVLSEDKVAFCAECGQPFASRAMVDRINSRLESTRNKSSRYLETCPACKARPRPLGLWR